MIRIIYGEILPFYLRKNLTRAFELNGWCQQIRGPKGGGLIEGLATPTFNV
ncbi:type VI secretion system contractile sheath domain-containing protein, partial [Piscirickettsia litoralis]|uniref:type VI secretion system contractile sheath domain-containing protein n=1 Tax=Piscirickettsia litoralis TaxID=1891921 RepID=UPI002286AF11